MKSATIQYNCKLQKEFFKLAEQLSALSNDLKGDTGTSEIMVFQDDISFAELKKQLDEKDFLIRNLTDQVNKLIKQNEQLLNRKRKKSSKQDKVKKKSSKNLSKKKTSKKKSDKKQ